MRIPGGLRLWISLASAGFLLAALLGNARQLLQLSLDPQGWLWLLLGVGLSLLSLIANGLAWGVGLRWLGQQPRWAALVQLFLASNLRKYLPGGVWHLLARLRALTGSGVEVLEQPLPAAQALMAVLLDPLLMAVAALALVPLGGWQNGLALLAPLPLLLLWPRWLQPLLRRLERQRARQLAIADPLLEDASIQPLPGYPGLPLLAELGFVLLRFAGFACCVQAFDLAYALDWAGWLAGFAVAWTAGLVVPGAPGGLGVFEAVLLLRLADAVPEAPLLALAVSYRLITALADLIAAGSAQADARLALRRSEG
jgi:glycosyltransferase 2 family protein